MAALREIAIRVYFNCLYNLVFVLIVRKNFWSEKSKNTRKEGRKKKRKENGGDEKTLLFYVAFMYLAFLFISFVIGRRGFLINYLLICDNGDWS